MTNEQEKIGQKRNGRWIIFKKKGKSKSNGVVLFSLNPVDEEMETKKNCTSHGYDNKTTPNRRQTDQYD